MQLTGFKANNFDGMRTFTVLPSGEYEAMIVASEKKDNSKKNGFFLEIKLEVTKGDHKGSNIWTRLNLSNPSKVAVDIANRELADICRATGVLEPVDSSGFHNIPMFIEVGIEKNGEKNSNVIKSYKSIRSKVVGGAQAAEAVPAEDDRPPWMRG